MIEGHAFTAPAARPEIKNRCRSKTESANIYEIPYRVLVPRDIDGLLVAGRAVSATHEALAAIRVMSPCFAMGEAAGTAGAMAVAGNAMPRHLSTSSVRERLRGQGVYLGGETVA